MKAIFSNKTIHYILMVAAFPYVIAGISSSAHANSLADTLADNSSALKDSIDKNYKLTELKTNEIKAAEVKPADAMTKAPADADFKKLDGNGDGKISLKEAVKDKTLATQFDLTDANHDGMLAADEYANYKAASALAPAVPVTN